MRKLRGSSWTRRLLHELTGMDQQADLHEESLRRAIGTLSQSDPLLKLLEQVKLRRMKPTDAGLRAVTESWLATYRQVLSGDEFDAAALIRLDPSPRLAVLVEAGILSEDHGALVELKTFYGTRLSSLAR
ncbi:MAG: hypothetical protein NW701_18020 [Nitrospira sp.]